MDTAILWHASPRQIACTLPDGAVLLHLDRGLYFSLNETGAEVWEMLGEPSPLDQILSRMRTRHPDAPESLDDDVRALLVELERHDLARVTS